MRRCAGRWRLRVAGAAGGARDAASAGAGGGRKTPPHGRSYVRRVGSIPGNAARGGVTGAVSQSRTKAFDQAVFHGGHIRVQEIVW